MGDRKQTHSIGPDSKQHDTERHMQHSTGRTADKSVFNNQLQNPPHNEMSVDSENRKSAMTAKNPLYEAEHGASASMKSNSTGVHMSYENFMTKWRTTYQLQTVVDAGELEGTLRRFIAMSLSLTDIKKQICMVEEQFLSGKGSVIKDAEYVMKTSMLDDDVFINMGAKDREFETTVAGLGYAQKTTHEFLAVRTLKKWQFLFGLKETLLSQLEILQMHPTRWDEPFSKEEIAVKTNEHLQNYYYENTLVTDSLPQQWMDTLKTIRSAQLTVAQINGFCEEVEMTNKSLNHDIGKIVEKMESRRLGKHEKVEMELDVNAHACQRAVPELRHENTNIQSEFEESQRMLDQTELDYKRESSELRHEKDKLQSKIQQMQTDLTQQAADFDKKAEQWLLKDFATKKENADLEEKLFEYKQAYEHLAHKFDSAQESYYRYDKLQRDKEVLANNIEKMKKQFKVHHDSWQLEKNSTNTQIENLKKEKEALLTRLSKIAGAKLTQGNAAITDLSDANRPTKLAEKYSELYDNEWTDALEEISDDIDCREEDGIAVLLQIIIQAYEFCVQSVYMYDVQLKEAALMLPCPHAHSDVQQTKPNLLLDEEEKQVITDLERLISPKLTMNATRNFYPLLAQILVERFPRQTGLHKQPRETNAYRKEIDEDHQLDEFFDSRCQTRNAEDLKNTSQNTVQTETKGNLKILDQQSENKEAERKFDHPFADYLEGSKENPYGSNLKVELVANKSLRGPHTVHLSEGSSASVKHVNIKSVLKKFPKVKVYAEKCITLCWLMRIKDPPVHMRYDAKEGKVLDENVFRHYTQSGKIVEYMVWPALYLQEKGALLAKGVAQVKKNRI